jgi:Phospholipase_D-nuclease N-terminal
MSFWDIIWFIIVSFAFVAYLMVMFSIIGDLFRDQSASGLAKAVWIIALIFLPFLTSIVYLIARGQGMAERSVRTAQANQEATAAYVRQVAGTGSTSPTDEIAKGKELLDSGAISAQEFSALKARVLGSANVPAQGTSV